MNRGWETISKPSGPHVLVSNGKRSIVDNMASDPDRTQLYFVHAVKDALLKLRREGIPKERRDAVSRETSRTLRRPCIHSINNR